MSFVEDVRTKLFKKFKPHTFFSEMFIYDKQLENYPDLNSNHKALSYLPNKSAKCDISHIL